MRAIPDLAATAALAVEVLPPGRRLDDALRESGSSPAFNRVLRAAISLRGGVSLAVWMAGSLAELDLVRRIRVVRRPDGSLGAYVLSPQPEQPTAAFLRRVTGYARVVAAAGYDEVQFDLMAGASAGGLGSVLYAVAQRAGTSPDAVLPVYRDLAGLQKLLQPPGLGSREAPMRGDAYFWRTATRAAAELYSNGTQPDRAHPDLVSGRLSVHLAATVINSEAESEPDVREGRGHFVFQVDDRRRNPLPNGIPSAGNPAGTEPPEIALLRLAYAARATSSLPGGFEVARVVSPSGTRREALEAGEALAPLAREAIDESMSADESADSVFASGRLRPDFAFAFSSHRPAREDPGDEGPYEVIDGGIFDNVPIDRALRVIKGTVGTTYGDRALLDFDPDPEDRTAVDGRPSRAVVPLWTVLAAWWQRVQRRESAAEELEEVHRFNAELMAEQGRLEALAAVVADVDVARSTAAERLRGYLRNLGGTDALFLVDAISRPSRWQLTSTLPRRRKLRAIAAQHLAPVLPALMAAYSREDGAAVVADRVERLPSALLDAGHAVLAWVRAVESRQDTGERIALRQLHGIRDHVSDALAFGHRARDAAAFRVLLLTSRHAATEPEGPVDGRVAEVWVQAWEERSRGEEGRARQVQEAAALVAHHRRLTEDIRTLRTLSPAEDDLDDAGVRWGETVWHAIDQRFGAGEVRTLDLIAVVAPSGMQSPMSLVVTGRISAGEQPAEPGAFPAVVAEERRLALQAALDADEVSPEPLRLSAAAKLAGHGLGNLPGLFSEDWRTNDWWWGRLDGAAGMLRFLASRAAGPAPSGAVEELVAEAQGALREEAGAEEVLRAGADTVGNLSPQYRTAVATRALSAALRSAAPARRMRGAPAGVTPAAWPRYVFLVLEFLLRPLLLVVPLAAAPVRLVVALGAVAGLGWGVTRTLEPDAATGPWVLDVAVAVVVAVATVLAILVATRRGVRRWRAIATGSVPRPEGVSAADSDEARRIAARLSDAAGVVAVLAAVLLGWSVAEGRLLPSAGWLLVTIGGAAWAVRARTTVPPLQAPLSWSAVIGGLLAFAVLSAAGPVLDVLGRRPVGGMDWLGLGELLAFAAVLSLVLVWGWESVGTVLVALLSGAVLWLVASLVLALVESLPGSAAAPAWIPVVAFLVVWSNALWLGLMLRPAAGFPSDAPLRTASPRWFTDPAA